jgi:hypothetical protein
MLDPLAAGRQSNEWGGVAGWCWACRTGNAYLEVPWLDDCVPLCWWCGAELVDARPV